MEFADLQRNWDAFGRLDPFWAILTDPDRRGNRWDPAEFFATGRQEMAAVFEHAARLGVPAARRRGLDFGCGAGRLTQALALYVDEVDGLDIAASMIDLAEQHNAHGACCRYAVNDRPDLSRFLEKTFDVVYTGRVLQHMEPRYAESYVRELVRVLAPGGYLSFDLPSEHGFFPADDVAARPSGAYSATLHVDTCPSSLACGQVVHLAVRATNTGAQAWDRGKLNIGNHWARADGSVVVRDDARSPIELPWDPGATLRVDLAITAPESPGRYRLQCDVVEEGVTWFADAGSTLAEVGVTVGADVPVPTPEPASASDEPAMEMHAVRRERVEQLLAESGVRLLDVRRVYHAGPTWLAFRYDCTKGLET